MAESAAQYQANKRKKIASKWHSLARARALVGRLLMSLATGCGAKTSDKQQQRQKQRAKQTRTLHASRAVTNGKSGLHRFWTRVSVAHVLAARSLAPRPI